ncbi:MAG: Hsp20/alpha crystallin family protein [Candidatus Asgardarchaeum sp.]|nr:Hsp20/alpha crystallin family protein [Candidatus Odinarchaeota archaeon]
MSSDRIRKRIRQMFDEMFEEIEREFKEMSEEIDELSKRVFTEYFMDEKPMWDYHESCLEATCEVNDTDDRVVIIIDLPYVEKKEDIEISIKGDKLEVNARFKEPVKFRGWAGRLGDVSFTHIKKTIPLPENINPEEAKAKFRNGMLMIEIPKKHKKVRIKIE